MANFAVAMAFTALDKISPTFQKWEKKSEEFQRQQKASFAKASEAAEHFKAVFHGALAAKAVEKLLDVAKDLPKQFEEMAAKGAEIGKMAKTIGVSTDELQRFRYAASMTEVSSESMDNALKKLNEGMGQLARHQGPLVAGLQRVNPQLMLQIKAAKSTKDAFLLVSDAMLKTTDAQKRAAMAQAVFGKAGQELIPMLLKGRDGLAAYMKEADIYGGMIGGEAVEASERFTHSMTRVKGVFETIKNNILGALLEKLNPLIEKFTAWALANKDIIATKIEGFIRGVGNAIRMIAPVAGAVIQFVGFLITHIPALIAFMVAWKVAQIGLTVVMMTAKAAMLEGATAQGILNAVMTANPIGLIIVGIAALIAFIVLMIQHWNDASGVFVIVKKSIMSLIALAFLPLVEIIEVVCRGLEVVGKLFGINMKGVEGFRKGMEGFIVRNTFLSGTDNSKDAKPLWEKAPNQAGLAAARVGVTNNINVDNSRAEGVKSSVRVAPETRSELAGAAGGSNL